MKKNILTLLVFIFCISGFSQKYFEGIVDYDIAFQSSNPEVKVDGLKEIFGTTMKFYHKDGTYMREYFDEKGNAIRKFIYLTKTNRLYIVEVLNADTVYYSDASEKLFDSYQITNGPTDTILNCICPSNIIKYRYYEKLFGDTISMRFEYFFCHQLSVNPDYYKNYFIWYDVIKEQKSVAIKFTEETENFFKMTYTAVKIEPVTLKKEIFEIDKKAVLIHHSMRE
jgi:hypothetical protein